MPRVPTYERDQQLRPAYRQGVDVRADPNAFGAGIGRAIEGVGQSVQNVANIADAWAEKEASTVAKEADNQYAAWERQALNDPATGFLNMQGRDAVYNRANVEEEFRKKRAEFGQNLTGMAAEMYSRAAGARENSALDTIIRHTGNQRKQWVADTSKARIETFSTTAATDFQDPAKVNKSIYAAKAELQTLANDQGWSPDTYKAEADKLERGIRSTVFEKYKTVLTDRVGALQGDVFNDPNSYDASVKALHAEIDASAIPDDMKAQIKIDGAAALSLGVSNRLLQDDPRGLSGSLGLASPSKTIGYGDPSLPAGMRNNNPGNIKYVGQGRDQGVVGPSKNTDQGDPQAVFETPEAGMAAAYKLALKKYQRGKTTANDLIAGNGGWTPGNTQAAANIARSMGLSPDDDLQLNSPDQAAAFLRGLVMQEHGPASNAYGDDVIRAAISGAKVVGGAIAAGSPGLRSHLDVAKMFLGASEARDGGAISSFIKRATGENVDPKQTAWCAYWLNAVFQSQGVQGTGSGSARSFLNFGTEVSTPEAGDVVIFGRGNAGQGHAGIIASVNADGSLEVVGGNQGQAVSIARFSRDNVLGFRRPPDVGTNEKAQAELSKLPGGGPSEGIAVTALDPRLAAIPFAQRLEIASKAQVVARQQQAQLAAERKQAYDQHAGNLDLRIVTNDIASEQAILSDGVLTDNDKAEKLKAFRTQQKANEEANGGVQAFLDGTMANLNPLDTDQSSKANKAYDVIAKQMANLPAEQQEIVANQFMKQTQIIPQSEQAKLRIGILADDPAKITAAMSRANAVEAIAPMAFQAMPGGSDLQKDLTSFNHMVNDRGFSAQEASQRLIERRSPEWKVNEEAVKTVTEKALKDLSASDITSLLDTSSLPFTSPGSGADVPTQNALLADYKEAVTDEMIATGGNLSEAKARAQKVVTRTWGVSSVSGAAQVMKYPPEKFYPMVDGSHDYLTEDAVASVRAFLGAPDVKPEGTAVPQAPSGNVGPLRPLARGEYRDNKDGSFSTEVTATIQDSDGKWVNVPSLWMSQQGWVDLGDNEDALAETAIQYEQGSKKQFPRFDTVDEAEKAASSRSKTGGIANGELAGSNGSAADLPDVKIALRPDAYTAADIRAGRLPTYRLFYSHEVDGQTVIDQAPGSWGMDAEGIKANGAALIEKAQAKRAAIQQGLSDSATGIREMMMQPQPEAPTPPKPTGPAQAGKAGRYDRPKVAPQPAAPSDFVDPSISNKGVR